MLILLGPSGTTRDQREITPRRPGRARDPAPPRFGRNPVELNGWGGLVREGCLGRSVESRQASAAGGQEHGTASTCPLPHRV